MMLLLSYIVFVWNYEVLSSSPDPRSSILNGSWVDSGLLCGGGAFTRTRLAAITCAWLPTEWTNDTYKPSNRFCVIHKPNQTRNQDKSVLFIFLMIH